MRQQFGLSACQAGAREKFRNLFVVLMEEDSNAGRVQQTVGDLRQCRAVVGLGAKVAERVKKFLDNV